MFNRSTKLRMRRRFRRSQQHVEGLGTQAEEQLEKLFFRRLNRLTDVRRFIVAWVVLVVLLIGGTVYQTRALSDLYQRLGPVAGGTYTEGVLGAFTNADPLYATGSVDGAVSHLLFSSLMHYDNHNQLVGDLADKLEATPDGLRYTLHLRPGVFWHDGEPLTANDVLFTYKTIQNADAKSPLFASWQGIKVEAPDLQTITFTLPNNFSAFPHSLTNGIVPKHVLSSIPAAQLRSARFNTDKAMGSGPFKLEDVEVLGDTPETREEQIGLVPNERYYRGAPKLQRFVIRAFRDENHLLRSFRAGELSAAAGLDGLPEDIARRTGMQQFNVPLTGQVMVFFKSSGGILADTKVRQALVQAVNRTQILRGLGYPVITANGPMVAGQIGYARDVVELPFDVAQANKLLDESGWLKGPDGMRQKAGKKLMFQLSGQSTSEYSHVAKELQKDWRAVGVDASVSLQSNGDLQTAVSQHAYDALLYGISVGADPDVYAYWHSSQADRRSAWLNFSEYKSSAADKALEAGRTRSDPALRAVKYRPFLEAWRVDAPALSLYQPRFLYVVRGPLHGFDTKLMNTALDRYSNVENWMIRTDKINQ